MPSYRGFILQPTYRTESGRPVVHLYGALEDGRPFLVRDRRQVPHFYIEKKDADAAKALGAARQVETDEVTLTGRPVTRIDVGDPNEVPPLRDRLTQAGIGTYEADVRFAMSYLIERGIRGAIAIHGEAKDVPGLGLVFDDPETGPADVTPRLRVLSIDIETDPEARRLLSVALYGSGVSEVLLLTPEGWSCPEDAVACANERDLLARLSSRVRAIDPDVITGWNVVDFDLTVLTRIAERRGMPLLLGRGPGATRIRPAGQRGAAQAVVPGRVVLDGIQLMRASFIRKDDYTLDAVAREELGEGKTLGGHGKAEEILRLFKHERERFVVYNRTDARLALEILEKLRLVELAVERSRLTGLPPDRVSGSIAAFDFLYLTELRRRRVVAPSVRSVGAFESQDGGHVLEPLPGLHPNVVVLDFKSLYPTLMRTFEIDPLNLIRPEAGLEDADPIVAPSGAAFSRRKAIVGALLDDLMPQREAARRAGDEVKSHAIKILMNSFYGVLGTSACRFYDARLPNAITGFGREMLLWCKGRIEASGRRVLYGDTDSLFVESGATDAAAARSFGQTLAATLNRELAAFIKERWRVESRLDLVFDRLYLRLCLPAMRNDAAGARKRYAGLVETKDGSRVVFTGMEAVRSDWTPLAKEVQRELYARLFADAPVEEYLREVVTSLRAGKLDDKLVYRKALRKPTESYTRTTPPHVAVARQLGATRGRIAYVITTAGPQPAEARKDPLDYDHYLEKQIQPVAEPVLTLLGLDLESVAGAARQMRLF